VAKIKRIKAVKKTKKNELDGLNPLILMGLNLTLLLILAVSFGLENFFYFKNRLRLTESLTFAEERATTKSSLSQSTLDEFDDAYQAALQNINAYVRNPTENSRALNIAKFKLNIAINQVQGDRYIKLRKALDGLMKKVNDLEKEQINLEEEQ